MNYACLCVAVSMCIAFTIVERAAAQNEVPQQVPPPAVAPAPQQAPPPVANPAVGTLRRQNRRQFLYEQDQQNDAEEALEKRGETAAKSSSNAAQNRGGGAAAESSSNAAQNRGSGAAAKSSSNAAQNRGGGAGRKR